jgi:hypothetical protein
MLKRRKKKKKNRERERPEKKQVTDEVTVDNSRIREKRISTNASFYHKAHMSIVHTYVTMLSSVSS